MDFRDRYFGKDYAGTHHTELFSCGMEAVTHGRFGGLTGRPSIFLPAPGGLSVADRAQPPKADTEHLALVLGLLASQQTPPVSPAQGDKEAPGQWLNSPVVSW